MKTRNITKITQSRVRKELKYLPEVGQFLYRKDGPHVKAGEVAGHKIFDGSIRILIGGKTWSAAKLAWLYVHGEWPEWQMLYLNGERDDLRIENLAPRPKGKVSQPSLDDLQARCEIVGDCWHWKGSTHKGSPSVNVHGRCWMVRRYIFTELLNKCLHSNAPNVSHSCESKDCINPKHLKAMSRIELHSKPHGFANNQLRKAKISAAKRAASPYTQDFVDSVRAMEGSSHAIAKELGLNKSTVTAWRRGAARVTPAASMWGGLGAR